MIVLQDRPRTIRQDALTGLGEAVGKSIEAYTNAYNPQVTKAMETKRQQALADKKDKQSMAIKLIDAGFAGTPEEFEAAVNDKGLMSAFLKNRSDDYNRKQEREDNKYKQEAEDAKDRRLLTRAQIAKYGAENQKTKAELNDITSGNKFKREMTQGQQKTLADANAKVLSVKSGIDQAIAQLSDPNIPEDEKLKVGQETLKLLNSAEGADAVGAEEAQRLGSKLEFAMGNFFNSNPTQFGRDIPGFTEQLKNNSKRLAGRIQNNEFAINAVGSGIPLSQIASQGTPSTGSNVALRPVQFNGQQPAVNFSPTNIPNISPVQNAVAGKAAPAAQHPQANQAVEWAKQNPNNPKAQEIMRRLGGN